MLHETPRPRQRRRQANHDRILDAAAQIVFSEGLEALSIKKVADAADYTPGALYRYFASKDALLAAIVVRVIEALEGDLLAARERTADPLARVVAQCIAYRDFATREPNGFALLTKLIAEPRVLIEKETDASTVGGAITRALLPIASALEASASHGSLARGDVSDRTLLLWSALQGALQLRKQERVAPQLIDADRLSVAMVRTLLAGWGADSQRLDAAFNEALTVQDPS